MPETEPRLSVVMPCRDHQEQARRAVASILAGAGPDVEVVVVDDGSTPPVAPFDDDRVVLVRRDEAGGPAAARNAGLARARGEVVAFCDSDDTWAEGRAAGLLAHHRAADVVVVRQDRIDEDAVSGLPATLADCVRGPSPHLGATSVRRSACPDFDDRFLACQDIEWWIRLVASGASYRAVDEVGYHVARSPHVRVLNSGRSRLDFSYALLETHPDLFAADRDARAFRWYRIAVLERRQGSPALARRALARSLRARPTALAGRELARIAWASARPGRPEAIGDTRLAPLTRTRGQELVPLRRATGEARQVAAGGLAAPISLSAALPRQLKGRSRRAATRLRGDQVMWTPWGPIRLLPGEVRLIAPYLDEPLEIALIARIIQPGMVVIDVGANRGVFTLMAAARVGPEGRVLAVEPDPRMIERLGEAVDAAGVADRVTVLPHLIAAATTTRRLVMTTEPSLNHMVPEGADDDGVAIDALTLDDARERAGARPPDLVKVDVEGFEPEVLHSLRQAIDGGWPAPVLMFEHESQHWARAGFDDADAVLEHLAGYDLFAVDYRTGGLLPRTTLSRQGWTGRNLIAIPHERRAEVLARATWAPEGERG